MCYVIKMLYVHTTLVCVCNLCSYCIRAESAVEREYDHQKVDDDDGEDSLLCDPEEMDLLGEIFDTLSSRSSHERGLLYGTRSLDLFGPDSHDFITKVGRKTALDLL